jgi:hypothetical protein
MPKVFLLHVFMHLYAHWCTLPASQVLRSGSLWQNNNINLVHSMKVFASTSQAYAYAYDFHKICQSYPLRGYMVKGQGHCVSK